MDHIFDFIFDEQSHTGFSGYDASSLGMLRTPDITNHSITTHNVPSATTLLSMDDMSASCSSPDVIFTKDENYGRPQAPMISPHVRAAMVGLIQEYLGEGMAFKSFLLKMRGCLQEESESKEALEWILRCILQSGHTTRMSTYLEENGVTKDEIETATANVEADDTSDNEFDIGDKRKRRDRKRVSISRGLRSPPNKWTKEESQRLIRLVFEFGDKSWKKIAEQLGGGKTGAQCAQHWKRVLSPEIRKGSWDDQEEALLYTLVAKHGQSWKNIAAEIKTRTDIQCRYQYQKACLSRQCDWLAQEDVLLRKKVALCLQERRNIIWTDVSKFIARAKHTKIPRTALECSERWSLLSSSNSPPTLPNTSSTVVYSSIPTFSPATSSPSNSPAVSSPHPSPPMEKKGSNTTTTINMLTATAAVLVC